MLYDDLLMKEAEYLDYLSPSPLSPSAFYHFDTPVLPTPPSFHSSSSSSSPSPHTQPFLHSATVNPSPSSSSSSPSSYSQPSDLKSRYEQSLDDALETARSTYNMLLDWMADLVHQDSVNAPIIPDMDTIDTKHILESIRIQKDVEERETFLMQEAEIRRVNKAIIEQAELVRVLSGRVRSENATRTTRITGGLFQLAGNADLSNYSGNVPSENYFCSSVSLINGEQPITGTAVKAPVDDNHCLYVQFPPSW